MDFYVRFFRKGDRRHRVPVKTFEEKRGHSFISNYC